MKGLDRAFKRQPREKVLHSSVDGWRAYWLHRGRLFAPLVGDLGEPVDKVSRAVCVADGRPWALGCDTETIPTTDCFCGWRLCDTVDALAGVLRGMCLRPEEIPAIIAADAAGRLDDGDMPVPVLARVRGEWVCRDDRPYRAEQYLTTNPAGRLLVSSGAAQKPGAIITEYPGGYRARQLTIIGPVLTGPVPLGSPDVRDLEQHYQVRYADVAELMPAREDDPVSFGDAFRMAADGRLPALLTEPYA